MKSNITMTKVFTMDEKIIFGDPYKQICEWMDPICLDEAKSSLDYEGMPLVYFYCKHHFGQALIIFWIAELQEAIKSLMGVLN